jgi:SAM-dependent methyltransferase
MSAGDEFGRHAESGTGEEVEAKPIGVGSSRPMSWGERVEQREQRKRAGKHQFVFKVISNGLSRVNRFSRSIGMTRRKIEADGVVYRERNNTSLRRALAATGSRVKEYDVRFPTRGGAMRSTQYPMRESMRIRYTHKRMFADLGHDPRLYFLDLVKEQIKPGDRVLELGCGTGGASERLAGLVGPSGGVVAIHRDGESIRFARQRYRHNHLAFELGWLETLDGELDGAFDGAVVVDLFRDAPDEPSRSRAIAAIWRLVRGGGVIVLITTDRNRLHENTDRLKALGAEPLVELESDPVLLWGGAYGVRAMPESSQ